MNIEDCGINIMLKLHKIFSLFLHYSNKNKFRDCYNTQNVNEQLGNHHYYHNTYIGRCTPISGDDVNILNLPINLLHLKRTLILMTR